MTAIARLLDEHSVCFEGLLKSTQDPQPTGWWGEKPQTYGSKPTGMKYHESWVYKHPNIQINYFKV